MTDDRPVDDSTIDAVRRAVAVVPDDTALRLHLAHMLVAAGRRDEAVGECAIVLQHDPGNSSARDLMGRMLAAPTPEPAAQPAPAAEPGTTHGDGFDWRVAEEQLGDIAAPMFVDPAGGPEPSVGAWEVQRAGVTLADVGGLTEVKERLEAAFLAPLRNPELRRLFAKSLRGGLLLYGPPGCGKTFVARAVAGEMGAKFISVGLSDVLDMWLGSSERNVHELFMLARREAPVVLFIDEIDALGQKRSQTRAGAMRGTVNQLLAELDGVDSRQRGRVRAGRHEPTVGHRPGSAAPRAARPDPARAAPR